MRMDPATRVPSGASDSSQTVTAGRTRRATATADSVEKEYEGECSGCDSNAGSGVETGNDLGGTRASAMSLRRNRNEVSASYNLGVAWAKGPLS